MAKNRAFDHSKYKDWIDPKSVIPYENNAKKHDDKQVANIANSIKRFGWQQDTVLTADNVVVIGHGRRLAALKLGCEMPYHRVDKNADELTDEDIRELRLVDNMTNESGWDWHLKEMEMADIEFDGFEFDEGGGTDFDSLDELFEKAGEKPQKDDKKEIQCPHCGMWFVP